MMPPQQQDPSEAGHPQAQGGPTLALIVDGNITVWMNTLTEQSSNKQAVTHTP